MVVAAFLPKCQYVCVIKPPDSNLALSDTSVS
jgi:hypothetical protein